MTRLPKDTLPQRRLLDLLRVEVDSAMESGRLDVVHHLVDENPHSVVSTHVLYNLGERRVRWLARVFPAFANAALPLGHDAGSVASVRSVRRWLSDT